MQSSSIARPTTREDGRREFDVVGEKRKILPRGSQTDEGEQTVSQTVSQTDRQDGKASEIMPNLG